MTVQYCESADLQSCGSVVAGQSGLDLEILEHALEAGIVDEGRRGLRSLPEHEHSFGDRPLFWTTK